MIRLLGILCDVMTYISNYFHTQHGIKLKDKSLDVVSGTAAITTIKLLSTSE